MPPFDSKPLVDVDFQAAKLIAVAPPSRDKGWRADPLLAADAGGLQTRAVRLPQPHVQLGIQAIRGEQSVSLPAGAKVMLAQEFESARGGHFKFTISASGQGSSREAFEALVREGAWRAA